MSENKKVEKEEIVEKKTPNVWVTILCIVLIIAMFFVGWFAGGKTAELEDKIILEFKFVSLSNLIASNNVCNSLFIKHYLLEYQLLLLQLVRILLVSMCYHIF